MVMELTAETVRRASRGLPSIKESTKDSITVLGYHPVTFMKGCAGHESNPVWVGPDGHAFYGGGVDVVAPRNQFDVEGAIFEDLTRWVAILDGWERQLRGGWARNESRWAPDDILKICDSYTDDLNAVRRVESRLSGQELNEYFAYLDPELSLRKIFLASAESRCRALCLVCFDRLRELIDRT